MKVKLHEVFLIVLLIDSRSISNLLPSERDTESCNSFQGDPSYPLPDPKRSFSFDFPFFFEKIIKSWKLLEEQSFPVFNSWKIFEEVEVVWKLNLVEARGTVTWELVNSEVDCESISRGLQRLTSRHLKVPQDQRSNFARVFEENLNLFCIVSNFIDIYQKCFNVLEHQ